MNFHLKIKDLLDELMQNRELLCLCKANQGYSSFIMTQKEYGEHGFILKQHSNGHTVEEAIDELIEKEEKGEDEKSDKNKNHRDME